MINYIKTSIPDIGIEEQAKKIFSLISEQKKVLWLICGGSNIPIAVEVMNLLRQNLSVSDLERLTIMQTDERYGPVGHIDSNWQQMLDQNFSIIGIKTHPILRNHSLIKTVQEFGDDVNNYFAKADVIVGQFGIGPDGHIAGILPHSECAHSKDLTCGYQSDPFTRISLSFPSLKKIHLAYVYVFGLSKKEAIDNLVNKDLSPDDEPAQILKQIQEVYFYSDQV